MKKTLFVDCVADVVCPWCHVGLASLERAAESLAADFDVRIRFRPYQLNADTPAEGVDRAAYYARKFPDAAALAAARAQIAGMARDMGFDFDPARPSTLPNTLTAHQAIALAGPTGRQHAFVHALYDGYWSGRFTLTTAEDFRAIADDVGMDGAVLARLLAAGAARDDVRAEIDAFRRTGVTGVPTYIVGERIGFSGAMPPQPLAEAIRDAARRIA